MLKLVFYLTFNVSFRLASSFFISNFHDLNVGFINLKYLWSTIEDPKSSNCEWEQYGLLF